MEDNHLNRDEKPPDSIRYGVNGGNATFFTNGNNSLFSRMKKRMKDEKPENDLEAINRYKEQIYKPRDVSPLEKLPVVIEDPRPETPIEIKPF